MKEYEVSDVFVNESLSTCFRRMTGLDWERIIESGIWIFKTDLQ